MTLLAQSHSSGTKNLNIGVGIGNSVVTGNQTIPPVSASFEVGIKDNISAGGYIGYTASKFDYPSFNFSYKYSYLIVGARGAYHHDLGIPNLDPYAGAMLGYNIASAKYDGSGSDPGSSSSVGGLAYSVFAGARYLFTDSLGAYTEIGYGISYLNLGVNFKM